MGQKPAARTGDIGLGANIDDAASSEAELAAERKRLALDAVRKLTDAPDAGDRMARASGNPVPKRALGSRRAAQARQC